MQNTVATSIWHKYGCYACSHKISILDFGPKTSQQQFLLLLLRTSRTIYSKNLIRTFQRKFVQFTQVSMQSVRTK